MVSSKGDLVFYETMHRIDGFKVSVFNYRLAQYSDFIEPVVGKDYFAHEMRGLCFVFNEDGSLFNRYLLLRKFFNLNQVTESLYDKVKDKKIKSVYNKEDGSLISFIKLPNGKVVAKTKMGFDNDQVDAVNKIYNENENIKLFIDECFEKDYSTMWEYVSFKNKIVLDYKDSNIVLLRVRNNKTGEYVDVEGFRGRGFDVVRTENFTDLDSIISWAETAKDVEGCVVTFEDDFMIKIKTTWYCDLHHLIDSINREDYVAQMVLNETIDDAISNLDVVSDRELISWMKDIEIKIKKYMSKRISEVEELVSKHNGSMKDFALEYRKDKNFALAASVLKGIDVFDVVKEVVRKETNKQGKAKDFLENI
jgi:T4 RnlA family RNA ligase